MRRTQPPSDRESVLDAAIAAGKIEASRRGEYARMYDANPQVIHNLLTARVEDGGLMPGLVTPADASAYDPTWLSPQERARLASVQSAPPRPAPAATLPVAPAVASASAPQADAYDPSWLSGKERDRIAAAKDGRLTHGPVQFEDETTAAAAAAAAAAAGR